MQATKLKNGTFRFTMTEEEYSESQFENPGLCVRCGAEAFDCEPDARNYKCEACEEYGVYGLEELLVMGRITFTGDDE